MLLFLHWLSVQPPTNEVAMADGLRSEGKIYVVVVGLLMLFAGLIGYVFWLQSRLQQLQKRLKEQLADPQTAESEKTSPAAAPDLDAES